jgi:hypothetical protein
MRAEVVLEDVGAGENGAKVRVAQECSPAWPRAKCGTNVCELEDHVGEKGWSSNWLTKLGLAKKNFMQLFPIVCYKMFELNSHFHMPYCDILPSS